MTAAVRATWTPKTRDESLGAAGGFSPDIGRLVASIPLDFEEAWLNRRPTPPILGRMNTRVPPIFDVHQGYRVLTHTHILSNVKLVRCLCSNAIPNNY